MASTLSPEYIKTLPPEIQESLANWESFQQNTGLMNGIAQQMKEVAALPSEKPADDDIHRLLKAEFPPEGGVLTYMEHYKYPYQGFPLGPDVEKIDIVKKMTRNALSGLYHAFKKKKWLLPLLFPLVFFTRSIVFAGAYSWHRIIDRFKLKPNMYSRSMRELHRAFSVPRENESEDIREIRLMLRDLMCMVTEFDNAYRFRFQDIIAELDKSSLERNPVKELIRLFTIAQSREKVQQVKDTWKLAKIAVWLLKTDRGLKSMIKDVLSEINLDEARIRVEDEEFCRARKDYNFKFNV